jgi:glycosyltransferase involved in cell wall biosynthesis
MTAGLWFTPRSLVFHPEGPNYHIALPHSLREDLPDNLQTHIIRTPDTPSGRLRWEQRILPRLAAQLNAITHLTTITAPLFTRQPVVVSPAGDGDTGAGFTNLLRASFGRGGMSNSRVLWPADLPAPPGVADVLRTPRSPRPDFTPHEFFRPPEIEGAPEIPDTYFLVHIRPDEDAINRALEAWTWAAGPIGEVYPLLFLDIPAELQAFTRRLARELLISEETLHFYPAVPATSLHLLYQAASAVFLPQPASPWGSPLQYALACAVPVIALETAVSSGIAGPAAYLIPDEDPRSLGAALIAVTVKDHLRKQLSDAALERTGTWSAGKARADLKDVYGRAD